MTIDHEPSNALRLTRRQLLHAGGLTLGALAIGRSASAQTSRSGGTLISAQTTASTRSWWPRSREAGARP
jgi:hypothetical protein